jgi:hypothetical protein
VRLPKRFTDLDPSWSVQIALNQYREAAARSRVLVQHLEAMVAEQAQRERDARRDARRNGR